MAVTVVRACRSQAMDADAPNTSRYGVSVASVRTGTSEGAMLTAWEPHLIAGCLAGSAASLTTGPRRHRHWRSGLPTGSTAPRSRGSEVETTVAGPFLDEVEEMSARGLRRLLQTLDDEWPAPKGTRCYRTARRLRCLANTTDLRRRNRTRPGTRTSCRRCLAGDTAGPHNGVGERAHCIPEATR